MVKRVVLLILGLILSVTVFLLASNSHAAADSGQAALSLVTGNVVQEKSSPADRLNDGNVQVYNDKIIIQIKDAKWASFTDTNSMDPVLDAEANAIQIVPDSIEDIHVGDIITYKDGGNLIIHRVIEMGNDENGWFCRVKGDNNPIADPGKIRFDAVTRITVGILY